MINALYIAQTGLDAHQNLIDIISNNLANSNTQGYKKEQVQFIDLVYSSKSTADAMAKNIGGNSKPHGVSADIVETDFSQGSLKVTNHPLDVAIQGEGMIEVNLPDGSKGYSRGGRLFINRDGLLSLRNGDVLSGGISIPPDGKNLVISRDGLVRISLPGEYVPVELGQLELVRFADPQSLENIGSGVYRPTELSGEIRRSNPGDGGTGSILQGYAEQSNVSMVEEMVNLMLAQRGYQLNARVLQVSDQILETINNLRR